MILLYAVTGGLLIASWIKDGTKTLRALKLAKRKFLKILPAFLGVLVLISLVLFFLPETTISTLLDNPNKWISVLIATALGSVALMPGFIAFPLCGLLLKKGVTYMVLSSFSTSLMMVGLVTFPLEKSYFGTKVTILRNLISWITALLVAFFTGLFFGEVFL